MGLHAPWDDDDYEAPSAEGGPLVDALEPQEGEEEGDDDSAAYASLTSFRPRTNKKKPVLTVDPDELAKEHEAFMHGAVLAMEDEEPHRPGAATMLGLSRLGEEDESETEWAGTDQPAFADEEYEGEGGCESGAHDRIDPDQLLRSEEKTGTGVRKKQALDLDAMEELSAVPDLHHEDEEEFEAASRDQSREPPEPAPFADMDEDWPQPDLGHSPGMGEGDAPARAVDREEAATAPHRPLDPLVRVPLIEDELPGDPFSGNEDLDRVAERLFGAINRRVAAAQDDAAMLPGGSVPESPAEPPAPEPSRPRLAAGEARVEEAEPFDEEAEPDILDLADEAPAQDSPSPRPHVMREYHFDDEADQQQQPEPDYDAAQAEHSRLRARLIRTEDTAALEPEKESLLGKLWRWLTGRA